MKATLHDQPNSSDKHPKDPGTCQVKRTMRKGGRKLDFEVTRMPLRRGTTKRLRYRVKWESAFTTETRHSKTITESALITVNKTSLKKGKIVLVCVYLVVDRRVALVDPNDNYIVSTLNTLIPGNVSLWVEAEWCEWLECGMCQLLYLSLFHEEK